MDSITYLTIAYKRIYVSQKLKVNRDWWKNKEKKKMGFDRSGKEIQSKSTVLT